MPRTLRLSIHTFTHFAIDFCCFHILFAGFCTPDRVTGAVAAGLLLYNILAFGLQVFIGALCDAHPRLPAARIGCVLVLLALLCCKTGINGAAAYAALILCALGNAWYHVGGGIDTLVCANGKMADSGVFVAAGSLGVLLGTIAGRTGMSWYVSVGLMAACLLMQLRILPSSGSACFGAADTRRALPLLLALLLLAVILRAYVGSVIPMPWKGAGVTAWLPALAAFGGKAAGGFLADRFGARRAGCTALLASAALLWACSGSAILCTLGIALFNVAMPITLCACCDLLPERPGMAFGLTTLALLVGVLPTFYCALPAAAVPWTVGVLTLAAFGCLWTIARGRE